MKESSIGKKGYDSLRIDGQTIANLPLGQGNEAREGLAEFLKTEKKNAEENLLAKFPKHKRDFLESQIKECRGNIKKIKNFKASLKDDIASYRKLIKDSVVRETELAKYSADNPEDAEAMKELRLKYPPYDVDALNQQIEQFEQSIERCDEVIENDYESINEIQQVLTLVNQKEKELRNI